MTLSEVVQFCLLHVLITAVWGEWGAWKSCSKTCGSGTQNIVKECVHHDFPDFSCEGKQQSESQNCSDGQCRKFLCIFCM